MDGDRLRQAIIESEKDYKRQRTQNGADNNMLRCRFHMKQHLILKLLEELPHFPMGQA